MAIPTAYRDTLLKQFLLSYKDFIAKKRKVAELEAKGDLTADETNILSHFQRDITRDRAIFLAWREGLQDHTKFGFTPGGYTPLQIRTFILNNRVAVFNALSGKYDEELAYFQGLKDQEIANAPLPGDENYPELVAQWQARLDELDTRKAKWQAVKNFILELRDKPDNDFVAEAEM